MKITSYKDPMNYSTHITSEGGTGAKGFADKIIEFMALSQSWEVFKQVSYPMYHV